MEREGDAVAVPLVAARATALYTHRPTHTLADATAETVDVAYPSATEPLLSVGEGIFGECFVLGEVGLLLLGEGAGISTGGRPNFARKL